VGRIEGGAAREHAKCHNNTSCAYTTGAAPKYTGTFGRKLEAVLDRVEASSRRDDDRRRNSMNVMCQRFGGIRKGGGWGPNGGGCPCPVQV
jgi:hypothetical protein